MLTGLSMISLIPLLVSAEQNVQQTAAIHANENQVAIHLGGEVAREYLRFLRTPRTSDKSLKDGTAVVEGFAHTLNDGTVRIHHVACARIVGEPVRLIRLESVVDSNLLIPQQPVDASKFGTRAGFQVELSDLHSTELRCSVMVGDFSNSRSYR